LCAGGMRHGDRDSLVCKSRQRPPNGGGLEACTIVWALAGGPSSASAAHGWYGHGRMHELSHGDHEAPPSAPRCMAPIGGPSAWEWVVDGMGVGMTTMHVRDRQRPWWCVKELKMLVPDFFLLIITVI
jgi:hypothetical protein